MKTDLIGQHVEITNPYPATNLTGKFGVIRSVFTQAKSPRLTVQLATENTLVELWQNEITCIGETYYREKTKVI